MDPLVFDGLKADFHPTYKHVDVGSGRCRMSAVDMCLLKLQLGTILVLELTFPALPAAEVAAPAHFVLCSVWPYEAADSVYRHAEVQLNDASAADENEVKACRSRSLCIDDTVLVVNKNYSVTGSSSAESDVVASGRWVSCPRCRIVEAFPPKLALSSFRVGRYDGTASGPCGSSFSSGNSPLVCSGPHFHGLPLLSGCLVRFERRDALGVAVRPQLKASERRTAVSVGEGSGTGAAGAGGGFVQVYDCNPSTTVHRPRSQPPSSAGRGEGVGATAAAEGGACGTVPLICTAAAIVITTAASASEGGGNGGSAVNPSMSSSAAGASSGAGGGVSTAVVDKLFDVFVTPVLPLLEAAPIGGAKESGLSRIPYFFRGVLLSGPPGTGKTFALAVLQRRVAEVADELRKRAHGSAAAGVCGMRTVIHEVNLPTLLSCGSDREALRKLSCTLREATPGWQRNGDPWRGGAPASSSSSSSSSATTTPTRGKVEPSPSPTPSPSPAMVYTPSKKSLTDGSSPGPGSSATSTPTTARFSFKPGGASRSSLGGSGVKTTPSASSATDAKQNRPATASILSPTASQPSKPAEVVLHLVVVDEVDGLGSTSAQTELQAVLKLELCRWMDGFSDAECLQQLSDRGGGERHVFGLVATTNRPNDVDMKLRRGGRMEIELDVLGATTDDRVKLLHGMISSSLEELRSSVKLFRESIGDNAAVTSVAGGVANTIAPQTGGYAAADIALLNANAMQEFVVRLFTLAQGPSPTKAEIESLLLRSFTDSLSGVQPSCLRGLTVHVNPKLTFDDIIGQADVKLALRRVLMFIDPAMQPTLLKFTSLANSTFGGVLLHGPPGNSKTRLVAATAAAYRLPLISLSSADVYSAYVGEAEAEVRKAFRVARQAAPCILFFDEVDALVTNRNTGDSGGGGSTGGANSPESRVLATFLTEMDGILGNNRNVFVFAATNRLEAIDAALRRKGRFHHILHVKSPSEEDVLALFAYFGAKFNLPTAMIQKLQSEYQQEVSSAGTGVESSAEAAVGISGAEVENRCKEALMTEIRNNPAWMTAAAAAATTR